MAALINKNIDQYNINTPLITNNQKNSGICCMYIILGISCFIATGIFLLIMFLS